MTIKTDNKNKEKHVNWKEMEEAEERRTRKKGEINKTLEQN